MPGPLPEGDPVPADGTLPASALVQVARRPLGFYVHVPFCRVRCGYCDFNTYVLDQAGTRGPGDWLTAAHAEIDLASRVLGEQAPPVSTVFFGGGTPTLMSPAQLGGLVSHIAERFGLADGAEVTTEANPETVGPAELEGLLAVGISRLSLGMQSAVPHVLATLDRVHTPGRALEVVAEARSAGFRSVSLDLIYGTPGESLDDWRASLEAAVSSGVEHVSAYALGIEPGTAMGRRVARGELAPTDDDVQADMYLEAERVLTSAGFANYEVSNWATGPEHQARHNLGYWLGHHWWGVGPGAHSHVGGVRWWNVKLPAQYTAALSAGRSPGQAREVLDDESRRVERVLLELRLADGLPLDVLTARERARLDGFGARGLVTVASGRVRLTLQGRLLADAVVRDLLD
ncbi:radical SAM family heme chaperone HemW [Brooklawnia cerclae]|uniref:Heme chaperone HemW n=1 Tax=Brooklawnia cerclae TaxID=349934 RepID=A0ABX0SGP1_9ACTN|nr:oxygen-independent coproporphyrinogen-3 oxidase [Brooklawnia cerclae]